MKNQLSVSKKLRRWTWTPLLIGLTSLALSSTAWGQCTDFCDPNQLNTAQGAYANPSDGGSDNTAFGAWSLNFVGGTQNTAIGPYTLPGDCEDCYVLFNNNNAFGAFALFQNFTGSYNTAAGNNGLVNNASGSDNTSVGDAALSGTYGDCCPLSYFTGSDNVAHGYQAMTSAPYTPKNFSHSPVLYNTALGAQALESPASPENTAVGFQALYAYTAGINNHGNNTSTGSYSCVSLVASISNTADGSGALLSDNGEGVADGNTAIGNYALGANTSGDNTALGNNAGSALTTGSNNIDIGNAGVAAESKTIRIGASTYQFATFIAGVSGIVVTGGQPVVVNSSGQLGVTGSSARFKEAIQSMDKKSESILALHPVSFHYKKELDPKGAPQFGLVAEDVAKVDPSLVVTDDTGEPFSVRYEEVNAMLLNEFLKEHRRVAEQEKMSEQQTAALDEQTATINELRQVLAQRQVQIKALSSKLQKVNSKLQMALPTARVVTND